MTNKEREEKIEALVRSWTSPTEQENRRYWKQQLARARRHIDAEYPVRGS